MDRLIEEPEEIPHTLNNTCRTCRSRIQITDELIPIFNKNNDFNRLNIDILEELNYIKLIVSVIYLI